MTHVKNTSSVTTFSALAPPPPPPPPLRDKNVSTIRARFENVSNINTPGKDLMMKPRGRLPENLRSNLANALTRQAPPLPPLLPQCSPPPKYFHSVWQIRAESPRPAYSADVPPPVPAHGSPSISLRSSTESVFDSEPPTPPKRSDSLPSLNGLGGSMTSTVGSSSVESICGERSESRAFGSELALEREKLQRLDGLRRELSGATSKEHIYIRYENGEVKLSVKKGVWARVGLGGRSFKKAQAEMSKLGIDISNVKADVAELKGKIDSVVNGIEINMVELSDPYSERHRRALDTSLDDVKKALKTKDYDDERYAKIDRHHYRFVNAQANARTVVGENLNANRVRINGSQEIIAAQYPLPCHMVNYFDLIKQEACPVVVVLSSEADLKDSRKNVEDYFSDTNRYNFESSAVGDTEIGEIKATLYNLACSNGFVAKVMHVKNWADFGVVNSDDLERLAMEVDGMSGGKTSLIHCNAGVGRTGTLITAIKMLNTPKAISLEQLVTELREDRNGEMVQSSGQIELLVDMAIKQGRPLVKDSIL